MENTEARLIQGFIKKENLLKAKEIQELVLTMRKEEKCSDTLVRDVKKYIEILNVLCVKFKGLSIYHLQKKVNPIKENDFVKFVEFHIELHTLLQAAKERMGI